MTNFPRILAIALFIVPAVFGQDFEPGHVHFGVLEHHGIRVEFRFNEASNSLFSGTVHQHKLPIAEYPPMPFRLEKTSTDTWQLSWDNQDSEKKNIDELRLIETAYGPALAGNQLKQDSIDPSINSYALARLSRLGG